MVWAALFEPTNQTRLEAAYGLFQLEKRCATTLDMLTCKTRQHMHQHISNYGVFRPCVTLVQFWKLFMGAGSECNDAAGIHAESAAAHKAAAV